MVAGPGHPLRGVKTAPSKLCPATVTNTNEPDGAETRGLLVTLLSRTFGGHDTARNW